jgi:peptide-methionine (S)-S-oxide reductase
MKQNPKRPLITLAAISAVVLSGCQAAPVSAEKIVQAPGAKRIAKETAGLKVAIFAGGCFWGVEGVFSHTKGVKRAVSGYHGGTAATATYKQTNTGVTGHAEAVRVVYDPKVIRYDQLLRIFFSVVADPTIRNRQGPDRGPQYRAALIPMSNEQRAVASAYLAQMQKSGKWKRPIVTKTERYRKFYPAENYHQDFMARNPRHGYILRWDKPKVAGLKRLYPGLYRGSFLRDFKG